MSDSYKLEKGFVSSVVVFPISVVLSFTNNINSSQLEELIIHPEGVVLFSGVSMSAGNIDLLGFAAGTRQTGGDGTHRRVSASAASKSSTPAL